VILKGGKKMVKILKQSISNEDYETRLRVVNEDTDKEILSQLAKDEDWYVRAAVAKNKNANKEILEQLARDERRDVREAVARNKNTVKEILELLSVDENYEVRKAIIRI